MSSKLSALLASNPRLAAALRQTFGFYLYDPTASGSNQSAAATVGELMKGLAGYNASASSAAGAITITPAAVAIVHTEVTAVTGAGSTVRQFALATANAPTAGARVIHRVNLPAVSGITLQWFNATTGGTQITSLITDGSGDDAVAEFYFDGTAWQFLRFTYPANP
jgi:hypothetical protein